MPLEFPFYRTIAPGASTPAELPTYKLEGKDDPAGYEPDDALAAAVNVALLLGQPLLLTGDPGTGKTQLAFHLSYQLGWGDPFVFEAKSTSTARDLFYTYDALGRFEAKDVEKASKDPVHFITYNALGQAILRSRELGEIKDYVTKDYFHDGPARSVVLIDEVDKAPRDFPNDILRELEDLYFKIPQIDNKEIRARTGKRPVVVITSNSEKNLPAAFLRRCTYYNIPSPSDAKLLSILDRRVGKFPGGSLYRSAIEFYRKLREMNLDKPPATAELIAWVVYLKALRIADSELFTVANNLKLRQSLSALTKSKDDYDTAKAALDQWLPTRSANP